METRFGVIVQSQKELVEKLKSFLEGKEEQADIYYGQVKGEKNTLSAFIADEDMLKIVDIWMSKRKYSKILDLWVQGLEFDWNKLYHEIKPRFLSLPTYPFTKKSYWLPEEDNYELRITNNNFKNLHPLLHQNTSTLTEQCVQSNFSGEEFFIKDCRIKGKKVIPRAVYLEIIYAAIQTSVKNEDRRNYKIKLKNIN